MVGHRCADCCGRCHCRCTHNSSVPGELAGGLASGWGWWVLMGGAGGCSGRLQLGMLSSCSAISLQCGFFKRKQPRTSEEEGLTEAEQQENGEGEGQTEGEGKGQAEGEGEGQTGEGEGQTEGEGKGQAEEGEGQAEEAEVAVAGTADTDKKEFEHV